MERTEDVDFPENKSDIYNKDFKALPQCYVSLHNGINLKNISSCAKCEIQKYISHIRASQFACSECDSTFQLKKDLISHFQSHKEKTFKCDDYDDKYFSSSAGFEAHSIDQSQEKILKDESSQQEIIPDLFLKKEIKEETLSSDEIKEIYIVKSFSQKCEKKTALHSPYPCIYCGTKLASKSLLGKHTLMHSGGKRFQCKVCKHNFAEKSHLVLHKKILHAEEEPEIIEGFKCGLCDKKLLSKVSLKTHIFLHSGEKPHECNFCNKKFALKKYLNTHILVHTKEKPFQCNICQRRFSQHGSVGLHKLNVHSEERPYLCDFCDQKYALKSNLKTHILKKHSKKK